MFLHFSGTQKDLLLPVGAGLRGEVLFERAKRDKTLRRGNQAETPVFFCQHIQQVGEEVRQHSFGDNPSPDKLVLLGSGESVVGGGQLEPS